QKVFAAGVRDDTRADRVALADVLHHPEAFVSGGTRESPNTLRIFHRRGQNTRDACADRRHAASPQFFKTKRRPRVFSGLRMLNVKTGANIRLDGRFGGLGTGGSRRDLRLNPALEDGHQIFLAERLAEIVVHPRLKAPFAISGHRASSQGDHRSAAATVFGAADLGGSLEAI